LDPQEIPGQAELAVKRPLYRLGLVIEKLCQIMAVWTKGSGRPGSLVDLILFRKLFIMGFFIFFIRDMSEAGLN
jgi:hypothetical protein